MGIVHLDIKPANIFFQDKPGGVVCKIGDFGMSTSEGEVMDGHDGDTKYLPLESLDFTTPKSPAMDVFSLGLTLLEIAAGPLFELPSEGERWRRIREGEFVGLPHGRSSQLSATIQAMIAQDPTSRPQPGSISEMPQCSKAGSKPDPLLSAFVKVRLDKERRTGGA